MPPATAWGWNPQLLAAGSAYAQGYGGQAAAFTDCPGTEAVTFGETGLCGLEGADPVDFLAVLASGFSPMKLRRVLRAEAGG